MPIVLAILALGATGVSTLLAGRGVIQETGTQVNRTGPVLVALAVAGVALYVVTKKKAK
jgi:hypothetical protein